MLVYEQFSMPEAIEADAHRLATDIQNEGFQGALIMIHGGGVSFVDVAEDDETSHFLKLIGGSWYELFEIGEPCGSRTTNH